VPSYQSDRSNDHQIQYTGNHAPAVANSIGAIAQAIGRPKSTISRELSRNKLPSGRYSPPGPMNCAGDVKR